MVVVLLIIVFIGIGLVIIWFIDQKIKQKNKELKKIKDKIKKELD